MGRPVIHYQRSSWFLFFSNQEHPFQNKTWGSCAVVGNGGILNNSSCGETIDSAQFVIRLEIDWCRRKCFQSLKIS